MQSGKLNKRVILQTVSQSSDGAGGSTTDTWADTATIWASITPSTGNEQFQADQLDSRVSQIVTIRYRSGVLTSQRLKFGTRTFSIQNILNKDERNEQLILLCEELPA